jgi:hypothetical protein
MAGLFDVGSIAPPGADFASTGPHLHVGVQDASGKYLDPQSARSFLLSRILVGQQKTPLYSQQSSGWVSSSPVTSPFGHREAPTAGASTEHMGVDFGVPQGTKLAWSSLPGDVYTPNKGFGTIQTTDPQGHPYTVKLLHTTPGAASSAPGATSQPSGAPSTPTTSAATGNVYNFYLGGKKQEGDTTDFLSSYMNQLMDGSSKKVQSQFNPTAMLMSAFNTAPMYE